MRIGYLVPEFPGQTHAFFWREILAIEKLGVSVDLLSTRRPAHAPAPHSWADAAIARTTYLHPLSPGAAISSLRRVVASGPVAWCRLTKLLATGVRDSVRQGVRTAGLGIMGARAAVIARERGWAHLHVHSCADAAHVALVLHLLSGLPYSMTLHGDLATYGKNQQSKWRHASFAIVVCEALRRQVAERIGPDQPPAVLVAPMGVDTEFFRRLKTYTPFHGDGEFRIFCCGRLHPGKGHEDLIAAVSLLRNAGLQSALTIAGSDGDGGRYRTHLESLIAAHNLHPHVRLAGALSEHDVRRGLEQSHLFVLASHQEALGVATMEAMAMQLPVIVSRTGGVPELVNDGSEGLLIEPRNPPALAVAIQRCAQSPDRCIAMGVAGRRRIETSFNSNISAIAMVNAIRHRKSDRSVGAQLNPYPTAAT